MDKQSNQALWCHPASQTTTSPSPSGAQSSWPASGASWGRRGKQVGRRMKVSCWLVSQNVNAHRAWYTGGLALEGLSLTLGVLMGAACRG
jgi:hypothetical protein